MPRTLWLLTLCVVCLASSVAASASDAVLLTNSDRLTGEIEKLEKGRLTLTTAFAGTIEIDWGMVETLTTDKTFQIGVENGKTLTGSIGETEEGVEVLTGDGLVPLIPSQMITMQPVLEVSQPTFWQSVDGTVDLGYSLTRGNSELNQSSVGISARYRAESFQIQTEVASLFSKQSDAPTTSRHTGSLRYDRYLGAKAFAFALTSLERDDRQLLNLRTNFGGGLGWKLIRSERTELSLLGGFTYVDENFRAQEGDLISPGGSSGQGLVGLSLEKASVGRISLVSKLSVHPNLVDWGRYRIVFDGGVRMPLIQRFSCSLRLFDYFDSRPPRSVQRNDYGLISSFGFTF